MPNPLDKLKKLKGRSLRELQTRGGQTVAAYTDKLGLGGNLIKDNEIHNVLKPSVFGPNVRPTAEEFRAEFFKRSVETFFPSIANLEETAGLLKTQFAPEASRFFVERADKILEGRFDLLGFKDLDFGSPVDWHFEPLSETSSPIKHWKEFDESDSQESGDKKIVWELNRHRHFFTLGVAYRITGNEAYADCFAGQLDGWMEHNPPGIGVNWVSSLEVSFRAMSWIWAFHLFNGSESFSSELCYRSLKYLFAHARHIEKYLSTYYSPNTHLTGEALGLYYLGTQLNMFTRSDHWRNLGEEILVSEIDRQIRPDGVYFEQSTWYQKYTTDFYVQFFILQKLNGSGIDSSQKKRVLNTVRALLTSQMMFTKPDGTTPLVGDDDGGLQLPETSNNPTDFRGTLATGAVIFERGDLKWVAGEAREQPLWLLGPKGLAVFDSLRAHKPAARSHGFVDSGFYIMRDGWTPDDNYMIVDAGEVGSLNGGHGHADSLSFELAVGGRTILADSGTYTYHRSRELRDQFRSSSAHNVLTIDEKSSSQFGDTFSWALMAESSIDSWISQDRFDFFEASHNGYRRLENSSAEYSRSVLFLKNDYWIMRDFVRTAGEHSFQQNFHFETGTNPVIESLNGGRTCVDESSEGEIGLRVFTFGDNGQWRRKDGWISKCYGSRDSAPFLEFASEGRGPQEFMTFLIPVEEGFERPDVLETNVPGGRAFVVNYRDYQDLFVFADGNLLIRTEYFNTDFEYLWARMSPGEILPEEFVLINGQNFSLNGREIFNYPSPLEFATARRFGEKLSVRTPDGVFSVSLPKMNSRTLILNEIEDD